MSATSYRRPTTEVLTALQSKLQAVEWSPNGGPAEAAFQSVKLFAVNSLQDAFRELLESKQRVCFIVPDDERFEPLVQGGKLVVKRSLPVALLVSDRIIGDRQAALFGGQDTPGAFGLAELALAAVTGQLINNPKGVVCKPSVAATVNVRDNEKKLPGRSCVELDVECTGGTIEAKLNSGPNL